MNLILALLACGSGAPQPPATANPAATVEAPAARSAQEILAAADAHDGTADKVVSECGGCMLGMEGDPAHAVEHEGYTLHFCSESCADGFKADPAKGVERLDLATTPIN